jgi:23S rRNA pseudouridine1911/1915/1917 synthase
MERRKDWQIRKEEADQTIGQFLKERLKLTRRQISSLKFCQNGILLNGEQRRADTLLKAGDLLSILLAGEQEKNEKIVPLFETIQVLYEDEDVLAVNKPPGILVHPVGGHYRDTLMNRAAAYFQKKGENPVLRPVGRLDKDTSGVVLFGKNRMAAARLSDEKEKGGFEKSYLAVVSGCVREEQGCVTVPIGRCKSRELRMQPDEEQGKKAVTFYEVVYRKREFSLLRLFIATGRTHQIRVHMAYLGHPLLGDPLYGNADPRFLRTALHAERVWFEKPFFGEKIEVRAPLPEDFLKFLGGKKGCI